MFDAGISKKCGWERIEWTGIYDLKIVNSETSNSYTKSAVKTEENNSNVLKYSSKPSLFVVLKN